MRRPFFGLRGSQGPRLLRWALLDWDCAAAVISVAGVIRTGNIRKLNSPLGITDELDEAPNYATFHCTGFVPVAGQEIVIGRGVLSEREFAGHIINVRQIYEGLPANVAYIVRAQDYTWILGRYLVNAKYTSESATDIVADLIDRFAPDFTAAGVEAGLPDIEEIEFTDEPVPQALTRIARRVGAYWRPDYERDIALFTEDAADSPDEINDANNDVRHLEVETDFSQVRTRVFCEGGGSSAPIAVAAGLTRIPLTDASWYPSSGLVKAGSQRLSFWALVPGGAGAILGGGVAAPTNAATPTATIGTGMAIGDYRYKTTFLTASGETLAGPFSERVVDATFIDISPPSAPSAVKDFGGNLSAGVYRWKVTFVDSLGGETTPSSASSTVTMDSLAPPSSIGTASADTTGGGFLDNGGNYRYKFTFFNGSLETTASPASNSFTASSPQNAGKLAKSGTSSPPAGWSRAFYRTEGDGSTYFAMPGPSNGFAGDDASFYYDQVADGSLGSDQPPSSSTAIYRKATVTIQVSPDPNVVSRRLYRTEHDGSTYKLVATIGNNTATSYNDNTADGSLGATAPSSNTAVYRRVALTSIPISSDPAVIKRRIYRTTAYNSSYYLLKTIDDNVTTTYTDVDPDGSLGALEPSTDTSGLSAADGQINAGSSTITTSSTTPFESAGGYARIGSQVIRYTGKTSSELTGVPTDGVGSLGATVRYGQEILALPMLTGIPSSGAGAIQYDIPQSVELDVLAQADDVAAQGALATLMGTDDGIVEHVIKDERLSYASALERATADLNLFKDPIVTIRYETRDVKTKAGKTVTVNLGAPTNLVGTFKIQRVALSQFETIPSVDGAGGYEMPLRSVEASSIRFSLEDFIRRTQLAP